MMTVAAKAATAAVGMMIVAVPTEAVAEVGMTIAEKDVVTAAEEVRF